VVSDFGLRLMFKTLVLAKDQLTQCIRWGCTVVPPGECEHSCVVAMRPYVKLL